MGGRPDTEGHTHVEFIHENSPTIIPQRMSSEVDPLLKEAMSPDDDDDWMAESQVEETKSSWFLFLLTFGGLGLQIGWSVETSNGSVSAFSRSNDHEDDMDPACRSVFEDPWTYCHGACMHDPSDHRSLL
jgi:hypothetical protein